MRALTNAVLEYKTNVETKVGKHPQPTHHTAPSLVGLEVRCCRQSLGIDLDVFIKKCVHFWQASWPWSLYFSASTQRTWVLRCQCGSKLSHAMPSMSSFLWVLTMQQLEVLRSCFPQGTSTCGTVVGFVNVDRSIQSPSRSRPSRRPFDHLRNRFPAMSANLAAKPTGLVLVA